jgi:heptosyltransferase II
VKILIHSPNWLGDAVMSMPVVSLYKKLHPEVTIDVLAKSRVASLWKHHPVVSSLHILTDGNKGIADVVKAIKKENYDKMYLLAHTFRAGLIGKLSGIKSVRGFRRNFRGFLLNEAVTYKEEFVNAHQVIEYSAILEVPGNDAKITEPGLRAPTDVALPTDKINLDLTKAYVGLMPGAKRGPSKQWPPEYYVELGKKITDTTTMQIVVLGDPDEQELCEKIALDIGSKAESLAGKISFGQWLSVVANAKVIICNDSGGMHVAYAMSAPLVAIFGITDPGKTGPLGSKSIVLQKSEIKSRAVPRVSEEATKALKRVTPDMAFDAVQSLLNATKLYE